MFLKPKVMGEQKIKLVSEDRVQVTDFPFASGSNRALPGTVLLGAAVGQPAADPASGGWNLLPSARTSLPNFTLKGSVSTP